MVSGRFIPVILEPTAFADTLSLLYVIIWSIKVFKVLSTITTPVFSMFFSYGDTSRASHPSGSRRLFTRLSLRSNLVAPGKFMPQEIVGSMTASNCFYRSFGFLCPDFCGSQHRRKCK